MTDWVGGTVGALVAAIGLYFAQSYRRQTRIALAQSRREAYARLWELTGIAASTRLDNVDGADGPITPTERRQLYHHMTRWYYGKGNGMLLAKDTREMYLAAKFNLACPKEQLLPCETSTQTQILDILRTDLSEKESKTTDKRLPYGKAGDLSEDELRGVLAIQQLSLLRTQMKSDLAIYGNPYFGKLTDSNREFLKHCHVKLNRRPWGHTGFWRFPKLVWAAMFDRIQRRHGDRGHNIGAATPTARRDTERRPNGKYGQPGN
jgi:hypothetical protein